MQSSATIKYIRRSPDKIRGIARQLRTMVVSDALAALECLPQMGAGNLRKAILSAASAATVKDPDLNTDDLVISAVFVDQGPSFKRVMPRARGRADRIVKRTSHIKVVLDKKPQPLVPEKKAKAGKKQVG
jgi:large subunit ribosomal protein L22